MKILEKSSGLFLEPRGVDQEQKKVNRITVYRHLKLYRRILESDFWTKLRRLYSFIDILIAVQPIDCPNQLIVLFNRSLRKINMIHKDSFMKFKN